MSIEIINGKMHVTECKCYRCMHGEAALKKLEKKSIKQFGWYAHLQSQDCNCPNHFNAHTHGLVENFGHLDLQCCMPMDGQVLMHIWHEIINKTVKKKISLRPNFEYFEFDTNGYAVKFIDAVESGRPVLRLVVPNKFHLYEGPLFADQFTMLDNHF